jgi:O-antigen ligase
MRRSRWESLGPAAIYLLVLGLALAVSPTPSDPILPLRLVILAAGLALGLLSPQQGHLPQPIATTLLVSALVFVAAGLAGQTPLLSLLGRFPRYEGLPVVLGYAAALVLGARLLGPASPRNRWHALNALVAGSLVNAVIAAVQMVSAPDMRVTGLLGNSTILATFSLLTLAMVGMSITDRNWWQVAGAAGAAFSLVASASRGALLGALIAAIALLGVQLLGRRRGRWWWGPSVAAAVLLIAWLSPGTHARLVGTTPFAESTITGRLLLWQETLGLVQAAPFLGVGPSRFVDSIGPFHTTQWAAEVGPYAPPDSPHNVILQVLASTGWLGLVSVIAILCTASLALWHTRPWDAWQAGAVLACVGVGVSYLTSFTDPVTLTGAAVLIGGAVSAPADRPAPAWARRANATGAAMAAAIGLVLGGTALVAESRYSAALTGQGDPTAQLLAVSPVRAWDADLTRRVGYTAARLAETGALDPAPFVAPLELSCAELPGSVECLQTLADTQDLAGQHQEALDTLNRATPLDPNNVDTLLKRGIALAELGRTPEAIEQFQEAARLRPTAAEPWDDLARAYATTGRAADAAQARATAEQLRHR